MYKVVIVFIVLFIHACSISTKQYDVHVINKTDDLITVVCELSDGSTKYKIKPQKRLRIISTGQIKTSNSYTTADDCSYVVQDIKAYNAAGRKSSLKWCSDQVAFNVVDIGQGEFTLTYTTEDF